MPADSERKPLPFEPNSKQKKPSKTKDPSAAKQSTKALESKVSEKRPRSDKEDTQIPEVVSRRMLRRMVFFSGIPVSLGILIFFASYIVITQQIAELPNVVVLLSTLACFGLSVVGLSYGALSASWEEQSVGTLVGLDEFRLNFGRLVGSWRQAREERSKNR